MSTRELPRLGPLPVYRNTMFDTPAAARARARGEVVPVHAAAAGLVANAQEIRRSAGPAFNPPTLDQL